MLFKKHLTSFQTTSEYELFQTTDKFVKPNVSYCKDECKVYYNPYIKDYAKDYFTIENTGDDILSVVFKQLSPETGDFLDSQVTISYRRINSDWVEQYEPINIEPHESIEIKANLRNLSSLNMCVMEGNTTCDVKGNIMSLLFGDDFIGKTDLTGYDYAFTYLFYNNQNIIGAENLVLPATTLADGCYGGMFSNCSSLTTAPELPATVLVDGCYSYMFYGCTNLNNITVAACTSWVSHQTQEWVKGVSATGTFTCPADLPEYRGYDFIPYDWTIVRV